MRRHSTMCCNKAGCFETLFFRNSGCPHTRFCKEHAPASITECLSCYKWFCPTCKPGTGAYCTSCVRNTSKKCRFCAKPQSGFYNGCTACGEFRTNLCKEHTGPPNGSYLCTSCADDKQCAHSEYCEEPLAVSCNGCSDVFCWKHARVRTYAKLCRTCGTFNCGCAGGPEHPCCFGDREYLNP